MPGDKRRVDAVRALGRAWQEAVDERPEDQGPGQASAVQAFDAACARILTQAGLSSSPRGRSAVHLFAARARGVLRALGDDAAVVRAYRTLARSGDYAAALRRAAQDEAVRIGAELVGATGAAAAREIAQAVRPLDVGGGDRQMRAAMERLRRIAGDEPPRTLTGDQRLQLELPPGVIADLLESLAEDTEVHYKPYRPTGGVQDDHENLWAVSEPETRVPVTRPPGPARARRRAATGRAVVNLQLVARGGRPGDVTPVRLDPGRPYWLRVDIGPRDRRSAAGTPQPLTTQALAAGELDVHVFPDAPLGRPAALGRLAVHPGRAARVVAATQVPPQRLLDRRHLHWRLTTPAQPGVWRVRCLLLARGTVVHVEQLTVVVGPSRRRVRQKTTFRLLQDLSDLAPVGTLAPPSLMLYANDGEDDGSDFSFLVPGSGTAGTDAVRSHAAQVALSGEVVEGLLTTGRGALAEVSWGNRDAFVSGLRPVNAWRDGGFVPSTSVGQLVTLARAGRQMWQAFAQSLDPDPTSASVLRERMRTPGVVALAVRKDPRHVVPLQLLYDKPLDLVAHPGSLTLCAPSVAWLAAPEGEPPCLGSPCPEDGTRTSVCLSGFWGLRHAIAVTLSAPAPLAGESLDRIENALPLSSLVTVATDPDVRRSWPAHEQLIKAWLDVTGSLGTSPAEVVEALESRRPAIAYFLTHVEVTRDPVPVPFLRVGSGGLDAAALQDHGLRLDASRPLVFLNGCASAALTPERLLGLIDRFLAHGASSAVGTEVTVFLDLATRFAEAFFTRFCSGTTLAEAMRQARIAVLAQGNPLGLAYTAYGVHGLRLSHPLPP
jgi:hypothetical protein